jgi:magnesium chelatase family protein
LVQSRALLGLEAAAVTVEVHLANGLPSFTLVGLADVEVKEARERVRSAMQNAGLEFPHNKRITVNLAPADLPKDSGRFDLPIALGILAASGQIDAAAWPAMSLRASCRCRANCARCAARWPWPGAACAGKVATRLVLPPDSAREAALVPGARVYRAQPSAGRGAAFLPRRDGAPADEPGPG